MWRAGNLAIETQFCTFATLLARMRSCDIQHDCDISRDANSNSLRGAFLPDCLAVVSLEFDRFMAAPIATFAHCI